MPSARVLVSTAVERTARVMQLEGLFDIPPTQRSELSWDVSLPLEEKDWSIGLVVGPSGSGKTTIARAFFGDPLGRAYSWDADKAVVDGFPASMPIKEVTELLSSVGFSSPPAWLRPFRCLSNGEQFRATIARSLAEDSGLTVVDEFTSVVDRSVAKVASSAIARTVRRRPGTQFVAVSCHSDIVDWLTPDWVYWTDRGLFEWRSLRRRPGIDVEIKRVDRSLWKVFGPHHYLSTNLHRASKCFGGFVEDRPAVFVAVLWFTHPKSPGWREHRTVCLPDFQGVGLGNAISTFVASLFRTTGKPYRSVTSAPAMIRHRARSSAWRMTRGPSMLSPSRMASLRRSASYERITASFEYVGPARMDEALRLGVMNAGANRGVR